MNTKSASLILRDYLQMHQALKKCDAIIVLGNSDKRTAERAAELFNGWYASVVIAAWGRSIVRTDVVTLDKAEADVFADIMMVHWVPKENIFIENQSTNTGENIQLAYKITQEIGNIHSVLLVHKPYMERRTIATFEKQWPDKHTDFLVTSLQLPYDQYYGDYCDEAYVIHMMVGEVQRIIEYPALWFQSYQEVPEDVLEAYEFLLGGGYTKQLIKT